MSFEQQKQEIIDFISNYTGGYARDELTKKINELKPDYPTCSTCSYFVTDKDVSKLKHVCSKLIWKVEFEPTLFGCIHHSDLENKNDNKNILDVISLIAAIAGAIVAFLHMIGINQAHGKNLHDLIFHSAYAILCYLGIVICFLAVK